MNPDLKCTSVIQALAKHPTVWDEEDVNEFIENECKRYLDKQAKRARKEGKR